MPEFDFIKGSLIFRSSVKPKDAKPEDPLLWICDEDGEEMPMDDIEDHAMGIHFKSQWVLTTRPKPTE